MSEATRRIQQAAEALGFLDPRDGRARYQTFQVKVAACLTQLPFHISEDERFEIASAAIAAVLRSGRVDASREPLAYCKVTAFRLAQDHHRKREREFLVGEYPEECFTVESAESGPGRGGERSCSGRMPEDGDVWDLVDGAIAKLPRPREQEVLGRQSGGQDDETIAEETHRSKGAIYQARTHGVESVRGQLEGYIRPGHVKPRRPMGGEQ
ncbi:RNA polymerase sigma factor [Streptomyces sp. NPDC102384]|uniref:RNA polymerase sigma factor n=1 Tax=Streptomyces sp. NPDC102384 TaxID=3366166 RepID=UPI0037F4CCE4